MCFCLSQNTAIGRDDETHDRAYETLGPRTYFFSSQYTLEQEYSFFGSWCTGCLNMNCQTSKHLLGIKYTLLSHKNGICTFLKCGNLTYDTWICLKITFLSSTASIQNDGRISLEIPSFCSEMFVFSKHQNKVILAISLLILRT